MEVQASSFKANESLQEVIGRQVQSKNEKPGGLELQSKPARINTEQRCSGLKLRIAARSQRQDWLTGLTRINLHSRVEILETLQEVSGGNECSGAVHAD